MRQRSRLPGGNNRRQRFALVTHPPAKSAPRRPASSSRGVEWQGWWEGPEGKDVHQFVCSLAEVLRPGTESVDEGPVAHAKLHRCRIVGRVDEGRGAAVGGGGFGVRVLGKNGSDTDGLAALLPILSFGPGLDFTDDAATLGLTLVLGHVSQARQRRKLDVERGRELRRQHGLAALASEVLGAAVEPRAAQDLAGGEGSNAVGARPRARSRNQAFLCPVGQNVAQTSMGCCFVGNNNGAIAT